MTSSAVARIRSTALRNNLERARAAAPGAPVLAVVKADAYGHGLEQVARILGSADAFGVARLSEAVRLREAGIETPIVVLSEFIGRDDIDVAREYELQLVLYSEAQVDFLVGMKNGPAIKVWLKIDSGMGRLGIVPAGTMRAVDRLQQCPAVGSDPVLMTHFASADERDNPATTAQLESFAAAIGDWPGDVSIANSAGLLGWPEALSPGRVRYAGRNWVRPGLMLYGVSPFSGETPQDAGLEPAMCLEGQLLDVREVPAGSRVGYGGEWLAQRASRIGVVNVGYSDGYPWRMPGGTPVCIAGTTAPIVGRISMDMISIDLTDVPDAIGGDRVTLWGDHPHVAELANRCGSSPYELLTGVGNRVERVVET